MFDYANMAATVLRLLQQFGQDVTLRQYADGAYSTATGANTVVTTDVTVRAAVLEFGSGKTTGPGGLLEVGDKRILMEPATAPNVDDHVLVGTTDYVVKGILEVNPAGTPVLYDLHVRKG